MVHVFGETDHQELCFRKRRKLGRNVLGVMPVSTQQVVIEPPLMTGFLEGPACLAMIKVDWPWLSWLPVHVRKTDINLIIIQIETYKMGSLITQERELGKNTMEAPHGFLLFSCSWGYSVSGLIFLKIYVKTSAFNVGLFILKNGR